MISRHHADIRLEEQLFNTLRDDLPECSVLHPSVESLVREFELDMVKNRNTPNDWHQSYVSCSLCQHQCLVLYAHSRLHVSQVLMVFIIPLPMNISTGTMRQFNGIKTLLSIILVWPRLWKASGNQLREEINQPFVLQPLTTQTTGFIFSA